MRPLAKNLSGQNLYSFLISVVFFSVYYLFLLFCIKPNLIYHYFEISQQSPFFKTGWLYFQESFSYPGGPSRYVAAFFTQLCYYPWLGALCITLVGWMIYRLTFSLVFGTQVGNPPAKPQADSPLRVVCYIPAVLMLMISGRYENPLLTGVSVLIVAFFSVLYEKIAHRLGSIRIVLFLIFSGVLYYFTGSAALIFITVISLLEYFKRGKAVIGVLCFVLGIVVCGLLGTYVFELETSRAYLYSGPFLSVRKRLQKEKWAKLFEMTMFVSLPVVVFLVHSGRRLAARVVASGIAQGRDENQGEISPENLNIIMQVVLLVVVFMPLVLLSFDRKAKAVVQISYYSTERNWPKVLEVARRSSLKRYYPFCNHAVSRALYFTGQMGDEMFVYPQDYRNSDLVFCLYEGGNLVFMQRCELCLELGMVNAAEKLASEFLESSDDSPYILKQFADLSIVKGEPETARVYLEALSKNLIYGRYARDRLKLLESDPLLESDERIRRLRSVMVTRDEVFSGFNENRWLEELLRKNRQNKMAFEYLMAYYLLVRDLDSFVKNLPRLDDFGYKEIPKHYQEAIVLYLGTKRKDVDVGERGVSVETIQQYNEFNNMGKKYGDNNKLLFELLKPRYGQTYFFYFAFGVSGAMQ